jgi:hypothetical protein
MTDEVTVRILQKESDEEVIDGDETDGEEEITTKNDHESESEQDCLTTGTTGNASNNSEDENSVNSEYFIGRDKVCKWMETDFSQQSKTRRNIVTCRGA